MVADTRKKFPGSALAHDFRLMVNRGLVTGIAGERRVGNISSLGGTYEPIWSGAGSLPFPTTAAPIRIRAGGNAADAAAGTGARLVLVRGLDANWDLTTDLLITAGASQSAQSTKSFIRVLDAVSVDVGTYGGRNVGDVCIERTDATEVALIPAGIGRAQMGFFSVPNGVQAHVCQLEVECETAVSFSLRMWQRKRADIDVAPFSSAEIIGEYVGFTERAHREFCTFPEPLEAKTDIWFEGKSSTGSAAMSLDFHMWLVDV
jgi:hypothetical protein